MITDRDMKNKIAEALGDEGTDEIIEGVFIEIHRLYGLIDIEDVTDFWEIAEAAGA